MEGGFRCQLLGGLWDWQRKGCALGVDTQEVSIPGTCLQPQQHVAHWLLATGCVPGLREGLPQGGSALGQRSQALSQVGQVSDGWSTSFHS